MHRGKEIIYRARMPQRHPRTPPAHGGFKI